MRIALVTCKNLSEPDFDEALVLEAFAKAGATTELVAWDDPEARVTDHDLVVLRSTWNYFQHLDAFLAWTARVPRLRNTAPVVRWNAVKTYLRELENRGVATVPTVFVGRGEKQELARVPWNDVVVKPLVSAGSFRTRRFRSDDPDGQTFLDELAGERDAMIQKWMPAVETYGERSLVWIDGELTHAIRKSPRFAGGVEDTSEEMEIAPEERAFAESAIREGAGAHDLLYARVDIVRDEDGMLRLMELELVEPSLFFRQCPRALDRFVRASLEHARR